MSLGFMIIMLTYHKKVLWYHVSIANQNKYCPDDFMFSNHVKISDTQNA